MGDHRDRWPGFLLITPATGRFSSKADLALLAADATHKPLAAPAYTWAPHISGWSRANWKEAGMHLRDRISGPGASITPDILTGERYALGTAVIQTTYLAAEVAGAAAGGVTVAFLGARPALVIDAVTFAASGLLIGLGTHSRPAVVGCQDGQGSPLTRAAAGLRLVFGDRELRTLVVFGWLVVFDIGPS